MVYTPCISPDQFDLFASLSGHGFKACSHHGGRLWEATFPMFDETKPDLLLWHCYAATKRSIHSVGVCRFFLCGPGPCERVEVLRRVLPETLYRLLGAAVSIKRVVLHELADASQLRVNFVIAGINGCGTSALRHNLGRHPDIVFTHPLEDEFFYYNVSFMFASAATSRTVNDVVGLYTGYSIRRSAVEWFNNRFRANQIVGLYNPLLWSDAKYWDVLLSIPRVRIVIVACNPVGRLEKLFYLHHSCRALQKGQALYRANPSACKESIADLLRMPEFIKRHEISARLHRFLSFHFQLADIDREPARMHFVMQDAFRIRPYETYSGFFKQLGAVSTFSESVYDGIYNSIRGHRTDLCKNVSLLRTLKRRLQSDSDYLAKVFQQGSGSSHPLLLLQRTRCERDQEIEAEEYYSKGGVSSSNLMS